MTCKQGLIPCSLSPAWSLDSCYGDPARLVPLSSGVPFGRVRRADALPASNPINRECTLVGVLQNSCRADAVVCSIFERPLEHLIGSFEVHQVQFEVERCNTWIIWHAISRSKEQRCLLPVDGTLVQIEVNAVCLFAAVQGMD